MTYADKLCHHGIKGQHWGERHGPPYPIENKVMKKGEHVRSLYAGNSVPDVLLDKKAKMQGERALYTYNADNDWDNKVYKGSFAKFKRDYEGKKIISEYEYEVITDLKMPTRQERVDRFLSLYDNKRTKNDIGKEMSNARNIILDYDIGSESRRDDLTSFKASKKPTTKKDIDTAYWVFNVMMEVAHSYKSTKEYLKQMSKDYDAMVDDNNQGTYNRAQDPVIFFNAQKVLRQYGDVRLVKNREINKNFKAVTKELKKYGEKAQL